MKSGYAFYKKENDLGTYIKVLCTSDGYSRYFRVYIKKYFLIFPYWKCVGNSTDPQWAIKHADRIYRKGLNK